MNVPDLVCDTLKVLLGTEFIEELVSSIHCEKKFVELKTGTKVPILSTSHAVPSGTDDSSINSRTDGNRKLNKKN